MKKLQNLKNKKVWSDFSLGLDKKIKFVIIIFVMLIHRMMSFWLNLDA